MMRLFPCNDNGDVAVVVALMMTMQMAVPTVAVVEGAFEFLCHPPSSHLGVPGTDGTSAAGTTAPVSHTDEAPKPEDTDVYHHRIHFNQFQMVRAPPAPCPS